MSHDPLGEMSNVTEALTPELMRQATFAQIGETVHDRIPASDFEQTAPLIQMRATSEKRAWERRTV